MRNEKGERRTFLKRKKDFGKGKRGTKGKNNQNRTL